MTRRTLGAEIAIDLAGLLIGWARSLLTRYTAHNDPTRAAIEGLEFALKRLEEPAQPPL